MQLTSQELSIIMNHMIHNYGWSESVAHKYYCLLHKELDFKYSGQLTILHETTSENTIHHIILDLLSLGKLSPTLDEIITILG